MKPKNRPALTTKRLVQLSWLVAIGCHARHDDRATPSAAVSVAAPLASVSALAPVVSPATSVASVSSSSLEAPTPAAVPFEIRPVVQVKHKTDGQTLHSVTAEPGVLLGPKRQLVKAFDCVSKGAPRADMFGVCVGFQACEETPTEPGVLSAIACTGPTLRVLLVQENRELVFKVADPMQPLAKRALSRIPLPDGARVELGPFERRNLTAYVDL